MNSNNSPKKITNSKTQNLHCYFCNKQLKKQQLFTEYFLKTKLCYTACNECIDENTFYSTYFIKSNFILEEKYLKETNFLFSNDYFKKLINHNNHEFNDNKNLENEKLYLESDILNLIKKQHKLREKSKEKENEINKRRKLIKAYFEELQLDYSETNDIYNFIYFGKSDLKTIITKYLESYNKLNETRYNFIKMLHEKKLKFYKNMLSYKKYLENNYNDLEDIINLAEIENKLINKTNYLNYIDNHELNINSNMTEELFNLSLSELSNKDFEEFNSNQQYLINKEFYLE